MRAARRRSARAARPGARGVTHNGLRIDFRVVEPDQFGNVLQHLTGSKQHNVELREYAVRRGMHVSEYGVEEDESGKVHRCPDGGGACTRCSACPTSSRSCARAAASCEAALAGTLPQLVTEADLRGDLHCHTTLSDGRSSLEDMAAARAEARATSTSRSPTTPPRTGSATTCRPTSCCARSSAIRELNERLDSVARAGRLGGEHQPRRLARLRGRRARRARLGRRLGAHVVPHGRGGA